MKKTSMVLMMAATFLCGTATTELKAQTQTAPSANPTQATFKLFSAIKAEELYKKQMKAAIDAQIKKNPAYAQFRSKIEEVLHKKMSWDKVKKDLAGIYVRHLTSAAAIDQITAFYQTSAGAKIAGKLADPSFSWNKVQTDPMSLTKDFSPEENQQLLAFMQTPAAMALMTKSQPLAKDVGDYLQKKAQKEISAEARKMIGAAMAGGAGGNAKFKL